MTPPWPLSLAHTPYPLPRPFLLPRVKPEGFIKPLDLNTLKSCSHRVKDSNPWSEAYNSIPRHQVYWHCFGVVLILHSMRDEVSHVWSWQKTRTYIHICMYVFDTYIYIYLRTSQEPPSVPAPCVKLANMDHLDLLPL
jgi:hypothetical protein